MKCMECPAACERRYAESNEIDFECLAGVDEDDILDDEDGCYGCDLTEEEAQQAADRYEQYLESYWEGFVKWLEEEEQKNDTEMSKRIGYDQL